MEALKFWEIVRVRSMDGLEEGENGGSLTDTISRVSYNQIFKCWSKVPHCRSYGGRFSAPAAPVIERLAVLEEAEDSE